MIDYEVRQVKFSIARDYIRENHYSHGCHNGANPCFGLFDGDELIGCLMFATPCSEAVRGSVFGMKYKQHVTELHRLHIKDCTPKNAESWFIARCLKELKKVKPYIWAVVTFADSTEGHEGTIYKATNAYRLGMTSKAKFYEDETGRLRHPRQNTVNIKPEEAKARGWKQVIREAKYRFMWLLPDNKRHKKELIELSKDYISKHNNT
ncbi:hypothetical protein D3C73_184900 [compost metagenome]